MTHLLAGRSAAEDAGGETFLGTARNGRSPGEESRDAALRSGDRGAAGLRPDQANERLRGPRAVQHVRDAWLTRSVNDNRSNSFREDKETVALKRESRVRRNLEGQIYSTRENRGRPRKVRLTRKAPTTRTTRLQAPEPMTSCFQACDGRRKSLWSRAHTLAIATKFKADLLIARSLGV